MDVTLASKDSNYMDVTMASKDSDYMADDSPTSIALTLAVLLQLYRIASSPKAFPTPNLNTSCILSVSSIFLLLS